jgi:hypothetical protein
LPRQAHFGEAGEGAPVAGDFGAIGEMARKGVKKLLVPPERAVDPDAPSLKLARLGHLVDRSQKNLVFRHARQFLGDAAFWLAILGI